MSKVLSNASFWLVDQNPYGLPEPPKWWQQAVLAYDKMLRLMPSQTDRAYRLCRIAKRESRLGLKLVGELHKHPDTVSMIKFGIVPELTLTPHAIYSSAITGLLRSRDSWTQYGGDAEKRVDAIERDEQRQADQLKQAHDLELDSLMTDSFRHVRYGYRTQVEPNAKARAQQFLRPLPPLPATLPSTLTAPPVAFRSQNR